MSFITSSLRNLARGRNAIAAVHAHARNQRFLLPQRSNLSSTSAWARIVVLAVCGIVFLSCEKATVQPVEPASAASAVTATVNPNGPIALKTSEAEFTLWPSGYIQATLIKDGGRLTLDEPEQSGSASSDSLVVAGKAIRDFTLDFAHAKVTDVQGKLGARGKRVEVTGRSSAQAGAGIEKTLAVEVYDDFPNLAVATVTYKNVGSQDLKVDRVVVQRHRLNASLVDPKLEPFRLWSFQGSAYDWGKDEILPLAMGFSRPNLMGGPGPQGLGGGIPVVDFWTAKVGVAIGHPETLPLVVSLPVKVEKDGRISASMEIETATTLKPGEVYSTPRSFVAVHTGDFSQPLSLWSAALQRQGWTPAKPTNADYAANWCGWGYEQDFTPEQMLGIIPKLKDLGFKWTTLDYRWFNNYGDWEPRADLFPGDTLKKVVDEYHRQGFLVQLWWQPLAAEDGQGKHALPKPMETAKLVNQHPDWLILDQQGRIARMISPVSTVGALCPALPEVLEYHRKLVERFMRDWGFDGNKMDSVFSVPPCYNPKHHHKSPDESIWAMADVYRVILETTRSIKPDSVTQICPCGTTPNLAWLPYQDQAVTADPVGGFQVRRRIKMYKALLGPNAAVYGDHVELSGMRQVGKEWIESGSDFASTVGTGGVIGTKFTWPADPPRPRLRRVLLTPEKEAHWKKWIDIYNAKMLSRGTFLDLYTIGYDKPEGYAIEKDGKMYYAFFADSPVTAWKGQIELRGLRPGRYQAVDYENRRPVGELTAPDQKLSTEFTGHLLIEVSKLP